MTSIENDSSSKQTTGNDVSEEASIYEDEINLMDYFLVLWKHKWFILLGSIMPTLMVGLIIFFLPRDYTTTYTYDVKDQFRMYDVKDQFRMYDVKDRYRDDRYRDRYRDQYEDQFRDRTTMDASNWNLNEKNYNVLISKFYSEENLNKIIDKLRENGLDKHAEFVNSTQNNLDTLKDVLKFEPLPPYIDITKIVAPEQLEQIQELTAQLLNISVVGKPKEDLPKVASVIRDNIEKVVPVYMLQEQLASDIRSFKAKMSNIENTRFDMELILKVGKAALEKLKKIKFEPSNRPEENIVLQFDVKGGSEYLPVNYQIQALEAKIVELEKKISLNEQHYNHYGDLLVLKEKLSAMLRDKFSSYYTIEQYVLFLRNLVSSNDRQELKDYLNSYIKQVENRISRTVPITESPGVSLIAKGIVKKTAITFVAALMLSIFAAFLLEGIQKSQGVTAK